jgi:hypothetical protein
MKVTALRAAGVIAVTCTVIVRAVACVRLVSEIAVAIENSFSISSAFPIGSRLARDRGSVARHCVEFTHVL